MPAFGYDTTVNGLISAYWNAEAAADAVKVRAVDAAYVVWANATGAAWSAFDNAAAAAAAGAVQALADAQSANDGWHAINSAAGAESTANSTAGNAYSHAVTALEGAFFGTLDPAWKTFADAVSDASTASTVAGANAYSAAVGRWAGQQGSSPYAAHTAAIEAAKAAKTVTTSAAYNTYSKAQHAAAVPWNASVVPAWVTKQNEVSDHAQTKTATTVPEWVTRGNAIEDAALAKTTAAVPLNVALTTTLNTNFTAWVSSVASADATYGDAKVDHGVAYASTVNFAKESGSNTSISNEVAFVHAGIALDALIANASGEAVFNWVMTVAGQLSGTPYVAIASLNSLFSQSASTNNGNTAYQQQASPTNAAPLANPPALPVTPPSIGDFEVTPEIDRMMRLVTVHVAVDWIRGRTENRCFAYAQSIEDYLRTHPIAGNRYIVYGGFVTNWWGPLGVQAIFGNPSNSPTDGGVFIYDRLTGNRLYIHVTPMPGTLPQTHFESYSPDNYLFPSLQPGNMPPLARPNR